MSGVSVAESKTEEVLVVHVDQYWFKVVDEWGLQHPDRIIDSEGPALLVADGQGKQRWVSRRHISQVYYTDSCR